MGGGSGGPRYGAKHSFPLNFGGREVVRRGKKERKSMEVEGKHVFS